MKLKYSKLSLAAPFGLALVTGSSLHAQTAWDGGGGSSDYSNNLNWATDIIPGNANANGATIGNASTQTVIYNTATSYTSTGTGVANRLMVGTGSGGNGSLTLSGSAGTLTFGGDAYNNATWIGSMVGAGNATGLVTVSAGKLAITGGTDASINLGVLQSGTDTGTKSGTLLINGGTVEVGRRILMGGNSNSSIGVLTISSGTLDMKRTGSSAESDLGMIRLGQGNNTVNLDGGNVILSGLHTSAAATARSTIYFNGTTLKANVATTDFITNGVTAISNANYRIKNGGLVFDTNTFNVTINDALTEESGHVGLLRKEGTGILTITGGQTRTGTTTVNGGTLRVSGGGSLGTGATTVSGSGSILDLDRTDTWSGHNLTTQSLTIQSGGLVTNGTAVNSGYNTVQTLALNGGELRVTGTARALADGGLFKFEAYGIRDSVTVTGTTASSITNPTAITNAGINIGGFTNLGGGVGSNITFNVADVTSSSAADLTVSAVLKNNYTADPFAPLSNGLVKTGGGTMVLSAINRYTGATTITTGKLTISSTGTINNTSGVSIGAGEFNYNSSTALSQPVSFSGTGGTLSGSGTITPAVNVTTGNTLAIGNSVGVMNFGSNLTVGGTYLFELDNTLNTADLADVAGNLALGGGILDLVQLGAYAAGDKFTLFAYDGTLSGLLKDIGGVTNILDDTTFTDAGGIWTMNYNDTTAGLNGGVSASNTYVTITAVPEPGAALLGGLGLLALLRRRR